MRSFQGRDILSLKEMERHEYFYIFDIAAPSWWYDLEAYRLSISKMISDFHLAGYPHRQYKRD